MFRNRHFFVLPLFVLITLVLNACQTAQGPNWWDVQGTTPQARGSAPSTTYDPTAQPRSGRDIVPWDPSQETVKQPDAQVKAEEWMTQYDVRGGVRAARVGLLLPLTGRAAKVGQEIMNAAQLALFDFAGPRYELLPYDTKSTAQGALEAVRYAISDGVSIIIGPLLSQPAQAISPFLEAANVHALAFTNDSAAASSHVFVLGVRPEEEVERITNFAVLQGSTRFALLAPADEYGMRIRTAFETAVQANGVELSKVVQFSGSDDLAEMIRSMADYDDRRKELLEQQKLLEDKTDALSQKALKRLELLQTIGDVDFDALLVAAGGKSLQSIAAHLPYYDVDPKKVRILGTSLWNAKWVHAEPALLGGWFASTSVNNRADFVRQFKATYAHAPNRLATLAYDAVALSAVLANEKGEADYSRETLTNPAGYLGRDGIFRLHPWGLAERGLSIMQVRQKGFREISPAPTSFAAPQS